MSELDPQSVLAIVTALGVLLYTGSWKKAILGLIFAPVIWYVIVSGAIAGVVLGFPILYVLYKILL